MTTKIGIVICNTPNPWFKVVIMDEFGNKNEIADGPQLDHVLHSASVRLGYPIVLPVSGPETAL